MSLHGHILKRAVLVTSLKSSARAALDRGSSTYGFTRKNFHSCGMFMMFAHRRAVMSSVRSVLALGRSSVGGSISSVSARNRRTPRARTSIAAGVGAILTGAFFSLKLRSTQHDGCDEKQKQTVGFWRNFVSQNIVPSKQQAIHN